MAQDAHIEYLSRREQAQALQILVSAGELIYYGILECQPGVNRRQPGNLQAMPAEIRLAQPGKFFPGNQQQMIRGMVLDQRRADLRHRINPRSEEHTSELQSP